ncbi:hypothetical protein FQR65_LT20150 [Abscondita terminalis]|nr:hypothetical protein FQR65_LT20150 [Abscondita terminalis]
MQPHESGYGIGQRISVHQRQTINRPLAFVRVASIAEIQISFACRAVTSSVRARSPGSNMLEFKCIGTPGNEEANSKQNRCFRENARRSVKSGGNDQLPVLYFFFCASKRNWAVTAGAFELGRNNASAAVSRRSILPTIHHALLIQCDLPGQPHTLTVPDKNDERRRPFDVVRVLHHKPRC